MLQAVNFPAGLRDLGTGAFENCVKLLRALLPEGLGQVGAKAFKRCRRLKELRLGKDLRAIGEQAFYGCLALGEVRFPDSLVSLGDLAFYRCKALGEVRLLPGMEEVGNLAFAQSGVERVRMEGSGRGYGRDIFFQCLRLRRVVLEEGVRHIPDRLAYGCGALEQVALPDTLESVGRNVWEGTPFLRDWMGKQAGNPTEPGSPTQNKAEGQNEIFWDGRHVRGSVSLPEETRIVAGGAFYGNPFLTEIRFSNHVTWIGEAALKGCTNLRRIAWPKTVTTAEPEVFSGCTQLETITLCPDRGSAEPQDIPLDVPWKAVKDRGFLQL